MKVEMQMDKNLRKVISILLEEWGELLFDQAFAQIEQPTRTGFHFAG